jgi:hypothetical protein
LPLQALLLQQPQQQGQGQVQPPPAAAAWQPLVALTPAQ